MAFLRFQGVVLGEGRVAIKGSAALVASQYVKPTPERRHHSKQVLLEKLGTVLWLSEDKRTGIFNSPTRGLVEYRLDDNAFTTISVEDERIDGVAKLKVKPEQHTIFADVHWLMSFMHQSGHAQVLSEAFPDRKMLARLYVHIAHTILKNGGKESCNCFAAKSMISHVFEEISLASLKSDSPFFHDLGQDHVRLDYFKAYVSHMRKQCPEFGQGCYVDSTPLPNEIEANVLKRVGNHGTDGPQEQSRLAIVLDKATGRPTWYKLFAGNINDINTLDSIISDVKASIDISLDYFVLDAGYVSKELIAKMCEDQNKDFIGRAPARLGFHHTTLFTQQVRPYINKLKSYQFFRAGHSYFGKKIKKDFFGNELYAYIYVDKQRADAGNQKFHAKNHEKIHELDEAELEWIAYKDGYFILLSKKDTTPAELLDLYISRTDIENYFKTAKDYTNILPLRKWNNDTINGKILLDIICTNILLDIRAQIDKLNLSVPETISTLQALHCCKSNDDIIKVDTPDRKVKDMYTILNIKTVPGFIEISKFRRDFGFV